MVCLAVSWYIVNPPAIDFFLEHITKNCEFSICHVWASGWENSAIALFFGGVGWGWLAECNAVPLEFWTFSCNFQESLASAHFTIVEGSCHWWRCLLGETCTDFEKWPATNVLMETTCLLSMFSEKEKGFSCTQAPWTAPEHLGKIASGVKNEANPKPMQHIRSWQWRPENTGGARIHASPQKLKQY